MAEYIEKETMRGIIRDEESKHQLKGCAWIEMAMDRQPAADVAPVRHGRWEKWEGDDRHHCSVCKCYANVERDSHGYIIFEFLDNYCSNCDAKMDGKAGERE